jgi:hypothetical protein
MADHSAPHDNMFLQQENLIKQQWLAVLFAAVVMDRTLAMGTMTDQHAR